jgi:polyhydroxybutyrate depolymerase
MKKSHFAWIGLTGLLTCILLLVSGCGLPAKSMQERPRYEGQPGFSSHIGSLKSSDEVTTQPIASSGCGKPAPFTPGLSENEILTSGGYVRTYRLHLPSGYRDNVEQALVLNFHGHGSAASGQEKMTQLSRLADQQDFIAVYPQGIVGPDRHSGWSTGPIWDPHVNDVLFVSDLLNHLQAELCIDPMRIYAMGFSNGGGMTNLLAARMAGRIMAPPTRLCPTMGIARRITHR